MKSNRKGRFVVIEGTDGSGKGTQVALLAERLKKEKRKFEITDFPQYGKPSAYFVEKYLRGEFGTAEEVGPYQGSYFYALDRFDKSKEMKKWLEKGTHIISNRYTTSNMGHQGSKITNTKKLDTYLNWLVDLEYKTLGNPVPDKVIFLYVPPEVGQKLVGEKAARAYTKGKKRDMHEGDIKHLRAASKAYLYIAKKFNWAIIDCAPKGELLSREEIHEMIWKKAKDILK